MYINVIDKGSHVFYACIYLFTNCIGSLLAVCVRFDRPSYTVSENSPLSVTLVLTAAASYDISVEITTVTMEATGEMCIVICQYVLLYVSCYTV